MTRSGKANLRFLVLVPVIALLDYYTKSLAAQNLMLGERMSIIPDFFNLTHIRNPGVAFGMLSDLDRKIREPLLIAAPVIALMIILAIYRNLPSTSRVQPLALSLIMGGAVGNLINRFQLGYVIDFLDFHWKSEYHYPSFNVADIAICIGVGLLMFAMFKEDHEQRRVDCSKDIKT